MIRFILILQVVFSVGFGSTYASTSIKWIMGHVLTIVSKDVNDEADDLTSAKNVLSDIEEDAEDPESETDDKNEFEKDKLFISIKYHGDSYTSHEDVYEFTNHPRVTDIPSWYKSQLDKIDSPPPDMFA